MYAILGIPQIRGYILFIERTLKNHFENIGISLDIFIFYLCNYLLIIHIINYYNSSHVCIYKTISDKIIYIYIF